MDDDIQELDASFLGNVTLTGELVRTHSDGGRSVEELDEINQEEDEDFLDAELDTEEAEEDDFEAFQGPVLWEEVDMTELEPVILRIVNAALLKASKTEVAARLEALALNPAENENMDPLGLGRMDTHNVVLEKNEERGRGPSRSSRADRKDYRRKVRRTIDLMQPVTSRLMSDDVDISDLRSKALPTSDDFDPDTFLGTFHAGTSLSDLLKGRQNLKVEVKERTGQLKALVKENFDRFISCKSTIDDIHKRLKISESHGSGNGTSTSDMVVVIAEVEEEARATFATLLDRAAEQDEIKSVFAVLKRYEHIFQIPTRIRQGTATRNFDQVIREYRKARALMDTIGEPKPKSLWHKLFTEVEQGVEDAVEQLEVTLRDLTTTQTTATDAVEFILQLQAEGSTAALASSPIVLHTQVHLESMEKELEELEHDHMTRLDSVLTQDEAQEIHDAIQKYGNAKREDMDQETRQLSRPGQLWAKFATQVIQLGATRLLAIQVAPEGRGIQSRVADIRIKVQQANEETLPMLLELGERFHRHIENALEELSKNMKDKVHFMTVVKCAVDTMLFFRKNSVQSAIRDDLEQHMSTACRLIIQQMSEKVLQITEKMPHLEDFAIVPSSHKAGHPASKVPNMLQKALGTSLSFLESVLAEVARMDTEEESLDALQPHCSTLRRAFCDSFSSFVLAIDKLWGSLAAREAHHAANDSLSPNIKLLVLQSNCVHLRTHILKELVTRYQAMLTSDGGIADHRKLMGECVEDMRTLEGRLATIYIKARVEQLNEVLDGYFEEDGTDWETAPVPTGVRDSTFEIINSLVAVQAEVYGNALSLQKRAMEEMVQHLFSAYSQCVYDRLEGISMGGALQLLMELHYISGALQWLKHRDHMLEEAQSALLKKIAELAADSQSKGSQDLTAWCKGTMGSNPRNKADIVSRLKSVEIAEATRFNIASLKT